MCRCCSGDLMMTFALGVSYCEKKPAGSLSDMVAAYPHVLCCSLRYSQLSICACRPDNLCTLYAAMLAPLEGENMPPNLPTSPSRLSRSSLQVRWFLDMWSAVRGACPVFTKSAVSPAGIANLILERDGLDQCVFSAEKPETSLTSRRNRSSNRVL